MSRTVLLGTAVLVLAFAVAMSRAPGGAQAHPTLKGATAAGPMMGPMHSRSLRTFQGFYDGKKYTYLSTDTSSKSEAAAMHINYSAALRSVKGAPAIYLVQGRAASGQLAAFGSVLGASDYSPLWEEMIVKWKAGVKPTLLTSDNNVLALQKKGKLSVTDAHVVLNCPMIATK